MDELKNIMEGNNQSALTPEKRIPDALQRELTTMRRGFERYSVTKMISCKLGCGKSKAYSLTHADSENAGSWCATHGWLFFDSVSLPPTERLSDGEREERRLEQQRKRGPRDPRRSATAITATEERGTKW